MGLFDQYQLTHKHSGGDGAQIDHGALAGLGDNDHPQYALDSVEGCLVFNNANKSCNDSAWTLMTFNSEEYDTVNMHSVVTNTSRLIAQVAGKHLATISINFAANATGVRAAVISLNGGGSIGTIVGYQAQMAVTTSGWTTQMVISVPLSMALGDYVEGFVQQKSGGALNVIYGAKFSPYMSLTRIK